MLGLRTPQRPIVLLGVVVSLQVLLLATQIRRERDVRLIRVWAVGAITPFQRTGAFLIDSLAGGWSNYLSLRGARRENEALRRERDDLRLRLQQLEGRAAEAERLARLLDFRAARPEAQLLAARVIAASPAGASKQIYLDRGEQDGVRKDMGVVTPEGVVGKVLEAYGKTSLVLLLTDRESGVGARCVSSRAHGVIRGTGEASVLMQYVTNDQPVAGGEEIVTSGQDRIFAKDLPLGRVISAKPGEPFQLIRVQPLAKLDRLEEVFVLLSQAEETEGKEAEGPGKKSP